MASSTSPARSGALAGGIMYAPPAGDLVVEELRPPGAAEGHEAEQDADLGIADALDGVLEGFDLEDGLRPEGVGPGPDLAPQLLYLPIQVFRCRVEGSPDEEARWLANGVRGALRPALRRRTSPARG